MKKINKKDFVLGLMYSPFLFMGIYGLGLVGLAIINFLLYKGEISLSIGLAWLLFQMFNVVVSFIIMLFPMYLYQRFMGGNK